MKRFALRSVLATVSTVLSLAAFGGSNTPNAPDANPNPGVNTDSGAVGSVNGSFRVNESGNAHYSVQILTPPGTGGAQPSISVNYDSGARNGLLGVGAGISGLSAITRCRQTQYQDQATANGITFDATDRFCYDGRRLVSHNGATYGAVNAEYRTEVNQFVRIFSKGGSAGNPDYWEVHAKDGSITLLGSPGLHSAEQQAVGSGGKFLSWSIARFEDNVGNRIRYTYYSWNDHDGHRIKDISYAYGTDLSGSLNNDGSQVQFEYDTENRPDIITGYVGGYKFQTKKRLTKIKVYNRLATNTNRKLVREYRFSYWDKSTHQVVSRLKEIKECVGADCYKPTKFTWTNEASNFGLAGESQNIPFTSQDDQYDVAHKFADINGDGRQDVIWQRFDTDNTASNPISEQWWLFATSNGTTMSAISPLTSPAHYTTNNVSEPYSWHMIDYNGDGKSDLMISDGGFWKVKLSTGTGFSATMINTNISSFGKDKTLIMDLNADGLPDLARPIPSGTYAGTTLASSFYVRYMERNGNNTVAPYRFKSTETAVNINALPHCNPNFPNGGCTAPQILGNPLGGGVGADFNGDGRIDLFRNAAWVRHAALINGPLGLYYQQTYTNTLEIFTMGDDGDMHEFDYLCNIDDCLNNPVANAVNSLITPSAVDINADGLTDLIVAYASGQRRVFLSNGKNFVYHSTLTGIPNNDDTKLSFIDYNNDGYKDVVWHDGTSSFKIKIWEDTGYAATFYLKTGVPFNDKIAHLFADISGDAHTDYLQLKSGQSGYLKIFPNKAQGLPRTKITKIDNNLGGVTEITYKSLALSNYTPLSDGSDKFWPAGFYHKLNGGEKDYPVIDITPSAYAVTAVENISPTAGTNPSQINNAHKSKITYNYNGAKIQGGGHGFLGFNEIQTLDHQSGIFTQTKYRQDFPFQGRPLVTSQFWWGGWGTQVKYISESISGPAFENWNGTGNLSAPYRIVPGYTIDIGKKFDTTNTQISKIESIHYINGGATPTFDEWGNMQFMHVKTFDGGNTLVSEVETHNAYNAAGLGTWYSKVYGRISTTTVKNRRAGSPEQVKSSTFEYYTSGNHKGMMKTETIQPGARQHATTHYYDNNGNSIRSESVAKVNAAGTQQTRKSRVTFDSQKRYVNKKEVWNGSAWLTESLVVTRDSKFGAPTRTRDMGGLDTYIKYDNFGKLFHQYAETGTWATTYRSYGAGSKCQSGTKYYEQVDTAEAGVAAFISCFDALGRPTQKVTRSFNGGQTAVRTEYDSSGRAKRTSQPFNVNASPVYWSTNTYDLLGRVTKVKLSDNSEVNTIYNGTSKVTTNSLNQTKTEIRNALGELLTVKDHDNSSIQYVYDAVGNLKKTLRKNNFTSTTKTIQSTFNYDNWGRKTSMSDPDKGNWAYQYNDFGELIKQTDAKGQYSVLLYDALGRMTDRDDFKANATKENDTHWHYDYPLFSGTPSLPGKLTFTTHSTTLGGVTSGKNVIYGYDAFGRTIAQLDSIDGTNYTQSFTYDEHGRPFQSFDASGTATYERGVENDYNDFGFLREILDSEIVGGSQASYMRVEDTDIRGNIIREKLGALYRTQRQFQANNGHLKKIYTDKYNTFRYQDLNLNYDTIGNLRSRNDVRTNHNLKESFCYDNMNRLLEARAGTLSVNCGNINNSNADYRYDAFGNMTFKQDVGSYTYGGVANKPHAVLSAGGTTYGYDANGNMISGGGRSVSYTTFDKAYSMSKSGNVVKFRYGADRKRYWRQDNIGGSTKDTVYVGNVEIITEGSQKTIKRHIGGKAIVILNNVNSNGAAVNTKKHYLLRDHLGSVTTVLDVNGVVQEMSFDAWGQRRNITNWQSLLGNYLPTFDVSTTQRGFTGHEMVDSMGLIHMNGRIYDPKLARFMQADPFVQAPDNTQSYNRYSYVWNNSLNSTDPSGYFNFRKIVGFVLAVIVSIACYGECAPAVWAAWAGAAGAVGGAVATGTVEGAIIGGISGAAFGYLGGSFAAGDITLNALSGWSALAGGIASELSGGKFGHGFASAGIGAFAGAKIATGIKAPAGKILAKIALGGTLSKATGGKFANGAASVAFATLLSAGVSAVNSDGDVEYYDTASETSPEFSYEERQALLKALNSSLTKLENAMKEALAGGKNALKLVTAHFGKNVDLSRLSKEVSNLRESSGKYGFHAKVRKMFSNDSEANGKTAGYYSGANRNIYLSKSLVQGTLSRSGSLAHGLFHEIAHAVGFNHTEFTKSNTSMSGTEFARAKANLHENYRDPYAYQGLLDRY